MEDWNIAPPVKHADLAAAAKAKLEAQRKAQREREEEAEIDKMLDDLDLVLHDF